MDIEVEHAPDIVVAAVDENRGDIAIAHDA